MQDSSEDFFPKACLPPLFMTVTPHKYHVFGVFVGGRFRMGGFHLSKRLPSAFFSLQGCICCFRHNMLSYILSVVRYTMRISS